MWQCKCGFRFDADETGWVTCKKCDQKYFIFDDYESPLWKVFRELPKVMVEY